MKETQRMELLTDDWFSNTMNYRDIQTKEEHDS